MDAIQVVWHGHYLSYFEVGREALGAAYGVGFQDLVSAGVAAPIVHACCDYFVPARHGDVLEIRARLHHSLASKLDLTYDIHRCEADDTSLTGTQPATGPRMATGHTTQVFVTPGGDLLLNQPTLMKTFFERWADHLVDT